MMKTDYYEVRGNRFFHIREGKEKKTEHDKGNKTE
jgi:hypothetical protein